MPTDVISVDDPRDADVRELLRSHLAFTTSVSPPEDMHALSLDGLLQPDVTLFGFRRDGSYAPSRNSTFMTLPLGERRSQPGFARGSGSGSGA